MTGSRAKNIAKYAFPTMLGCLSFFLYTIVDTIYVGWGVGQDALGAINITVPFVIVVGALFQLGIIGGVTIIAIRVGEKDKEGANQAFMHSLTFALSASVLLCLVGTTLAGPLCRAMGASTQAHYEMSKDYLFCYAAFLIPAGISSAFQGFCRNDGAPVLVSIANVTGSLLNVFLDWLFIFPLKMGVKGAAISTGIAQTVVLVILCPHFIFKKGELRIRKFRPMAKLYWEIVLRGLPEAIAQCATAVTTILFNRTIGARFDTETATVAKNAYSILSCVTSFSLGIFFGLSDGLQPVFGQTYGAKEEKETKFYLRAGAVINFACAILIFALLFFVSAPVCRLFGADGETLAYTVEIMPRYAWGFLPLSLNTLISAYLFSTKRTAPSVAVNALRSFAVNAFVILLFPVLFGNGVIWHTFGIYESVVLVVAALLLIFTERRANAKKNRNTAPTDEVLLEEAAISNDEESL